MDKTDIADLAVADTNSQIIIDSIGAAGHNLDSIKIDYYYLKYFSLWKELGRVISFAILIVSSELLASLFASPLLVAAQEQIRLIGTSDQDTFRVEIMWTPNNIGSPNTFDIRFIDPDTGSEIENVKYDILLYRDGSLQVQHLNQTSTFQDFSFSKQGTYEIRIEDIEDLGEGARIPIQVTPEFPPDVFAIAAVVLGAGLIITARDSNNNLFRQWTN